MTPARLMLSEAIAAMPRNGVADAIARIIAENTATDREAYAMADQINTRLTHHLSKRETPPPPDHAPVPVHEPDHLPGEPAPGSGFGYGVAIMLGVWGVIGLTVWLFMADPMAKFVADVRQAQEIEGETK